MTELTHIDVETLSAYADGELKPVTLARVERHLVECVHCRATLDRLGELAGAARSLPREVAPPAEVWAGIVARRVPGPASRVPRWWHNGWLASAAAVVLVAGTALLMSAGGDGSRAKAKGGLPSAGVSGTPVAVAVVDRRYEPTLAELREAFESQREMLRPSTVQTLERSLAVIDDAIAEARAALAADPASAALAEILSSYYRRKVDFLKRASTISVL